MAAVVTSSRVRQPVQGRARATVEAIVEATSQLIESGTSVSTDDVARRAGVSVGSLYQYFSTKDTLLAAVLRRELDEVHRATLSLSPWRTDPPLLDLGEALIGGLLASVRSRRRGLGRLLARVASVWRGRGARLALATQIAHHQLESRAAEVRVPSAHRDAAAFILPALVMCAVDASALAWPELLTEPVLRAEIIALLGYRLLAAEIVENHPTQRAPAAPPRLTTGAAYEGSDPDRGPSRRDAAARRDQLLDAALDLATDAPWRAVTPRAIARRAGVSATSFYTFFDDKEDALRAAMVRDGHRIAAAVEHALDASTAPDAAGIAQTAVTALLCGHRARATAYGALLREGTNPGTTREEAQIFDRIEHGLDRLLSQDTSHGVPPERRRVAAFLLARVPVGVVHWALRERPELLDAPQFEAELSAVVSGYVVRAAATGRCR